MSIKWYFYGQRQHNLKYRKQIFISLQGKIFKYLIIILEDLYILSLGKNEYKNWKFEELIIKYMNPINWKHTFQQHIWIIYDYFSYTRLQRMSLGIQKSIEMSHIIKWIWKNSMNERENLKLAHYLIIQT